MPTAADILQFLFANGLSETTFPEGDDMALTSVVPEDLAELGALSWISRKRIELNPARLQSFRGTLLLAPEEIPPVRLANGFVVPCRAPKLAFSRAVDRFFPELTKSPWTGTGESAFTASTVSPLAQLGPNVVIGAGCVIGEFVEIGPGTVLAHTTVAAGTRIGANCSIGLPGFGFEQAETGEWFRFPHIGNVSIGSNVEIGSNTCIDRGALGSTTIGDGAKIDNLVHIAHNVDIGANALVIAHAMIGGSARIGEGVWIAPSVSVKNQVTVGARATVGMGAAVLRDVAEGKTVAGVPAKELQPKA